MRGRDIFQIGNHVHDGITPARAGKSSYTHRIRQSYGDHPRACGEESIKSRLLCQYPGSPPRVRGRETWAPPVRQSCGITPARAGKRNVGTTGAAKLRDHPRACGEEQDDYLNGQNPMGSPPRVRGRDLNGFSAVSVPGITPARAGKRPRALMVRSVSQDHPRACGEECWSLSCSNGIRGSPPHVRGRGHGVHPAEHQVGITPACAGKSSSGTPRRCSARDHPRMCGEEYEPGLNGAGREGSPPHVRGRARPWRRARTPRRITPACAGKR